MPRNPSMQDEQEFHTYICPACGDSALVPVEYDYEAGSSFPVNDRDTICAKDFSTMDKE